MGTLPVVLHGSSSLGCDLSISQWILGLKSGSGLKTKQGLECFIEYTQSPHKSLIFFVHRNEAIPLTGC